MGKKVAIIGCGKIGIQLGEQLAALGFLPTGYRRNATTHSNASFEIVALDVTDSRTLSNLKPCDLAVVILPPAERSEQGYKATYQFGIEHLISHLRKLGNPPPCIFVSSTSVYAQDSGEWIDEESATNPSKFNGKYLLEAEQTLLYLS